MTPQRFHNLLIVYLDEYRVHLSHVKSNGYTATHISIVHEFIDYMYNHHLVGSVEQITVSMCCSKFMAHYKRKKKEIVSKEVMKKILKGYFEFLGGKYGLRNEKLMNGFKT